VNGIPFPSEPGSLSAMLPSLAEQDGGKGMAEPEPPCERCKGRGHVFMMLPSRKNPDAKPTRRKIPCGVCDSTGVDLPW